jgi:hypothetical protein
VREGFEPSVLPRTFGATNLPMTMDIRKHH